MNIKKALKVTGLSLLTLILLIVGFGYWFIGLIRTDKQHYADSPENTQPWEIPYLAEDSVEYRGKLLAVVTSTGRMGTSGKSTGYELTELSRAYYVFTANGFEVDIASPKGGNPPVVIDDDDVDIYDFAFLNDTAAQRKATNTLALSEINIDDYEGVYFVGGKGAMYDFPDNPVIQKMVSQYYESDKVVGAVCHGPAALVNVKLSNGQSLIQGKKVSSFTNEEELFLIPDAEEIFPFLLQTKLTENGASFQEETMYLENVVWDGNLLTGQNPWSTWPLAESMISQLGYTPKPRVKTAEEQSVRIIKACQNQGVQEAKDLINQYSSANQPISRELIAIHSITSAMQFELGRSANLIRLLSYMKGME